MWTFRSGDFSGTAWPGGVGDKTTWMYEDATGLLLQKLDAANQGPTYTYGPGGRLATRTWARGGTTTYGYDDATGELLSVDYSDPGTPDIAYTYDRLGRQKTVTDAVGTRTFVYDPDTLQLVSEDINGVGAFDGVYDVSLARKYEPGGGPVAGRSTGFQIGNGSSYDVTYGYDAKGRFGSVAWSAGTSSDTATYSYVASSDLLAGMTTTSGQATSYQYEPLRNLKTQVQNSFGGSVVSQYDYRYDELGRRKDVVASGSAFGGVGGEELSKWGYDDRNQLTTSNRHAGTNPDVPGAEAQAERRSYGYDPIGNRQTALGQDGTTSISYTPNELNQYVSIDAAMPVHDLDGNMTSDGTGKTLTYNGENRLVGFSDGTISASYVYDYIGRRVMKTVGAETRTFLYDGWNMVREDVDADGAGPGAPVAKHSVWGLDLSQSMQGAGGIGGLIAVVDESGAASLFAFDGNGNVSEVVTGGVVDAHYEYDAFGNVVPGTGGGANPWQFSTKYVDGESGYSYYGMRFYTARLGRWLNRDPISETGGLNLYAFASNNGVNLFDILGQNVGSSNPGMAETILSLRGHGVKFLTKSPMAGQANKVQLYAVKGGAHYPMPTLPKSCQECMKGDDGRTVLSERCIQEFVASAKQQGAEVVAYVPGTTDVHSLAGILRNFFSGEGSTEGQGVEPGHEEGKCLGSTGCITDPDFIAAIRVIEVLGSIWEYGTLVISGAGIVGMAVKKKGAKEGAEGVAGDAIEEVGTEDALRFVPTRKHQRGGWGTEMDLSDDVAQQVLERSTSGGANARYAFHEGKLYEFYPDQAGGWHGYPIAGNEAPTEVLRALREAGTITSSQFKKLIKGKL